VDALTELLLAARDGDRLAFGAFVRRTQGDVWALAGHLVAPAVAEDVAQDAYLRAWRALPRYRGDAPARLWLLAIVRRTCADAVRTRVRRRRLERHAPPRPEVVGDAAVGAEVQAAVAQLAPDRRAAFVLTQVIGLEYSEAAAVCGCPVGTIRSRVARARADLVAALADADADARGAAS
jgi:RNA polymerase sigma-70 factor, ECF subfamily